MVYSVQEILSIWESMGIFEVVLPFLLVFAVVFGILSFMKIFGEKNRGIHVIIALVIGILAIRNSFFLQFYEQIFPRLGIGVTIILAILILAGMFVPNDERRYWGWGLAGLGAVIGIIILLQSFSELGWTWGFFSGDIAAWVIGAILLLALIIAVATSGSESSSDPNKGKAFFNALFGRD